MTAFGYQRLILLHLMAFAIWCLSASGANQLQIVITSSQVFKDTDGLPLSRGTANVNKDGDLVQFGYFSGATSSDLFAGDWIPLTEGPYIGDSPSLSGGTPGTFQASMLFLENSPIVTLYPKSPGEYQVVAPFTITSSAPSFDQLVAIRFFDRPSIEAGVKYNTIADTSWSWGPFAEFPFPLLNSVNKDSPGLAFQDPDNPYVASVGMNTDLAGQPYRTVSANITGGGQVKGLGKYEEGATAQLQAVAEEGYDFIGWSGDLAGEANTGSFVVNSDKVVNAEFQIQTFDVSTGISPAEGGSVSGGGTYDYGELAVFTAIPANGFHLQYWSLDGEIVPNNEADGNDLVLEINQDRTVKANFGVTFFSVTITQDPETGGSATGGGTFTYGTVRDITAIPATGFGFEKWEGPGILDPNSASTSVSVTADLNLVAKFAPLPGQAFELTVSETPAAGGSTSGGGIYSTGTGVDIVAIPAPGYYLDKWVDGSGNFHYGNPLHVTVQSALTRTARFTKQFYKMDVIGDEAFEESPPSGSGTYTVADNIVFTAFPADTWELANWSLGGYVEYIVRALPRLDNTQTALFAEGRERREFRLVRGATYRFNLNSKDMAGHPFYISTSPDADLTGHYEGEFIEGVTGSRFSNGYVDFTVPESAPDTLYYHTSSTAGAGGVISVYDLEEILPDPTANPATIPFPVDLSLLANYQRRHYPVDALLSPSHAGTVSGTGSLQWGTQATFEAIPAADHVFSSWVGLPNPGETQNPVSITIDGPLELVANFSYTGPATHHLSLTANPPEGGTVSGGGDIDHAIPAFISAIPAQGYRFVSWTGGTVTNPSLSSTSTPILLGDVSLAANFELIPKHTLTLQASQAGTGTLYGAGDYFEGSTVTIIAQPATLYAFAGWTGHEGIVNPSSVITQLTLTEDATVAATFVYAGPNEFDLALLSSPAEGGTTEGAGTHENGSVVPIKAIPAIGYVFERWSGGSPTSTTSAETEIKITKQTTLTAKFTFVGIPEYKLGLLPNPLEGGMVTGAGNYEHGTGVQIQAIPAENYIFLGWSGGTTADSTAATTTINLVEDTSLFANFQYKDSGHSLQIATEPTNGGTATGAGSYPENATANLLAIPAEGYKFTGWTGGTVKSPSSAQTQATVSGNLVLTANFALLENFTLSTKPNPASAGTASGAGQYLEGTDIEVTAIPAEGYTFIGWSGGQTADPSGLTTTHTLSGNTTLYANFLYSGPSSHTLSLAISPWDAGSLAGAGAYGHGASVLISATARPGYLFRHWTDGAGTTITQNPASILLEANHSLTAIFDQIQITSPLSQETGEWMSSRWLGLFLRTGSGWIFTVNHGWLYPSGGSDSSVWLATPDGKWYWTSEDAYPWFFCDETGAWVYYSPVDSSPSTSRLFDTAEGKWTTVSPPGLP